MFSRQGFSIPGPSDGIAIRGLVSIPMPYWNDMGLEMGEHHGKYRETDGRYGDRICMADRSGACFPKGGGRSQFFVTHTNAFPTFRRPSERCMLPIVLFRFLVVSFRAISGGWFSGYCLCRLKSLMFRIFSCR